MRRVLDYAIGAAMLALIHASGPVIALYEYFREARRSGLHPSGMYVTRW